MVVTAKAAAVADLKEVPQNSPDKIKITTKYINQYSS
jgi:hypothetical protein